MDATASDSGLLLYGSGGSGTVQFLWMDRASKQLTVIADGLADIQSASLSPQNDRIALQIDTGISDTWVLDLARGTRTRLTFGPVYNNIPQWSPDGKWIVYTSERNGKSELYRKPSDGSGAEEELLEDSDYLAPLDWSRDGKYILYQRGKPGSQNIWALPLDGDRKPFVVITAAPNIFSSQACLSPDGRWLTYMSNESGTEQVYVTAFRSGRGKWQISANGGFFPTWSHDGKELYYVAPGNTIEAVPVKAAPDTLQFGASQTIVSNWSMPVPFYQVSTDGKKILLYRVSQAVGDSVTVITNFPSTLKK
jgi:Tol biopolymer transport system component